MKKTETFLHMVYAAFLPFHSMNQAKTARREWLSASEALDNACKDYDQQDINFYTIKSNSAFSRYSEAKQHVRFLSFAYLSACIIAFTLFANVAFAGDEKPDSLGEVLEAVIEHTGIKTGWVCHANFCTDKDWNTYYVYKNVYGQLYVDDGKNTGFQNVPY